ncbi:MAG: hypothetical protein QM729_12680 [Solirubrobacterales bacterium]
MRIDLKADPEAGAPTLHEPDDFKGFSVLLEGEGPAAAALARLGRVADDGEHVFVDPQVLRELAGDRAADPAWSASLEGMIGFAAEHGWVDEAGFIRAHVERGG